MLMIDERELLERAARKIPTPDDVYGDVSSLRDRRTRRRRIASGIVALVIAAAAIGWAIREVSQRQVPADHGAALPGIMAFGSGAGTRVVVPEDDGLTDRFLADGMPLAWSPDGSRLLVLRDVRVVPDSPVRGGTLVVLNPDGSEEVLTPPDVLAGEASWSPDGARIVFRQGGSIALMNANGSDIRILRQETPRTRFYAPSWSPDGTRIAYIASPTNTGLPGGALYLMDAAGSGRVELLGGDRYLVMYSVGPTTMLSWSPDGSQLAFVNFSVPLGDGPEGQEAIQVVDVRTSNVLTMFKAGRHECSNPSWMPDGSQISFMATLPAQASDGAYLIRPDGSDLHRADFGPNMMPSTLAWRPSVQPLLG